MNTAPVPRLAAPADDDEPLGPPPPPPPPTGGDHPDPGSAHGVAPRSARRLQEQLARFGFRGPQGLSRTSERLTRMQLPGIDAQLVSARASMQRVAVNDTVLFRPTRAGTAPLRFGFTIPTTRVGATLHMVELKGSTAGAAAVDTLDIICGGRRVFGQRRLGLSRRVAHRVMLPGIVLDGGTLELWFTGSVGPTDPDGQVDRPGVVIESLSLEFAPS